MAKIAFLAIAIVLLPLLAFSADVSIDGFCDNWRQIHLINFPYSVSGEYFYFTDQYGNIRHSEYLTQPNKTVIAIYNDATLYIRDQNNVDIVPAITLPDCGLEFGRIDVDMSNFCNYNNYQTIIRNNYTADTGQTIFVVGAYTDPNHCMGCWNYAEWAYYPDATLNIYGYSPYYEIQVFHQMYYWGYIPLASRVVKNFTMCANYGNFTVDSSDFCDNFRRVNLFVEPYQNGYYYDTNYPWYTYGFYNPYSTASWISNPSYALYPGSWSFTSYGRFSNYYTQSVTVPDCTGNYGPLEFDSTGFCGNGWGLTVTNTDTYAYNQNGNDYYHYFQRVEDNYDSYSVYVYPQSSSTIYLPPGDYIVHTKNNYYFPWNGTYQQVETSHHDLSIICPTQYGTLTIDTSNYCPIQQTIDVTVPGYSRVQIDFQWPAAKELDPLAFNVASVYNYNPYDEVRTLYLRFPGYYSAHVYPLYSGNYPIARNDFTVPPCAAGNPDPAVVDTTGYCTNFRRYTITIPTDTVFFFYDASNTNKVLKIFRAENGPATFQEDAYASGTYSLISFEGNVPDFSKIVSRTDVDFDSCGDEYGPTTPIIDAAGYCNNFKRVTITYPGYPNVVFSVYYQNTTYIGQLDSNGDITLPFAGQYMLIYGTLQNPGARHFFSLASVACPVEFGVFTIDTAGFCNNHKRIRILVPPHIQYFIYTNGFDPNNGGNYDSYVYNYDNVPAYKDLTAPSSFTVASWHNNDPNDRSVNGFVTSRKDFVNVSVATCPDFFGPEFVIPSCDLFGGTITIGGVVQNTQYSLYSVSSPYDDITFASPVNNYYVNSETQIQIVLPFSSLFVFVAKSNNNILSKLFIDGIGTTGNGSTSFTFPPTVLQGEVAYAQVSLSGLPAHCLSEATLCKFGSVVIEAVVNNNVLQCQVPLLPTGTYSVAFSTDGGVTFTTSCRTIQVQADTSVVAFDYKEFTFDNPEEAYMVWDRMSTAGQGLNYVKIEAYEYNLLNVAGNAEILVFSKVDVLFNRSMNIGYFKWNTSLYDLSFLALQISFGNSYTHYTRRAVAYVQCRWSYCGRRSFCERYGYVQPAGDSTPALNPFDQACKSHAVCSADPNLCPSYCDEVLTSMLTSVLYGRVQANPFSLSAPASSSYSAADLKWARKAVISYSKAVSVVYRETPTTAPVPCPSVPILTTTISTMACGDPHYTIDNIMYDMQLPGEFLYFSGHVKRSTNSIQVGSTNFQYSSAPTQILTQQRPIVTTPHFISLLTGVTVITRQAPHSSVIVMSTNNGVELYHDGIKINSLVGCIYYFVGGSIVYQSEYQVSVILDDGIELSISGGWGSICMTMTISGIFVETTGFYGGVSANGNNLIGKCNNGSTMSVVTGCLVSENLALGRCWKLSGVDNLFDFYGLGLGLKRDEMDHVSKPRNLGALPKRVAECDAIPNALLAEMCNADLPYLPEVPPEAVAAVSQSTAETYNLATGINLYPTLSLVGSDVVLTLNVSLQNWDLTVNPLKLAVQTKYGSSADLQSTTSWTDFEIFPQDYNVDPIVITTLYTPAENCTTYFARAQVISLNTNFSSPWISMSYATDGACFSAIIANNEIIVSNDLPDPSNFTEIAATDPDPVTTDAITVGFVPTTQAVTSGPITSRSVTSRAVTTRVATSSPVTSSALTSGAITSSPLTSSPLTSSPITTHAVTTGQLTVQQRCATYSFTEVQAYFCAPDHSGYYQCLSGAYSSQSAFRPCAPGTSCKCAEGVECSAFGLCTNN